MKRNRRAGVEDRWNKTAHDEQGNSCTVPSANHGKGSRWRARYVDDYGKEHAKAFTRKAQAQAWLNKQVSDQITGAWTDPRYRRSHSGQSPSGGFLRRPTGWPRRWLDTGRCSTP